MNNIVLEKNGKLFYLWVMKNFKDSFLPKIDIDTTLDKCDKTITNELTIYQKFISNYLNYNTPFKDILLYHGVGSGKIHSVINIYNLLYKHNKNINIVLLLPASLYEDPWMKELKKWLLKENYDDQLKNILFIHYDSPKVDNTFFKKIKKLNNGNQTLFIIEEVHNFINLVYNNISNKKGKRAQNIYDYIYKEKQQKNNIQVILLSATPVINTPFEFSLIFNLLRPGIFPSSESLFYQLFINNDSINNKSKNMFQRRITGLVSYYIGNNPNKYVKKNINYVKIEMGEYQEKIYNYFEKIDKIKDINKLDKVKIFKNNIMSSYCAYTRQAANFVFPSINNSVNGELRPIPDKYKIKLTDFHKFNEYNQDLVKKETIKSYLHDINTFIIELQHYFKKLYIKDNGKHITEITDYIEKYKYDFDEFYKNCKSELIKELYKYGPKFVRIIFNIFSTKGIVMIYSNYVSAEGLQILKIYLELFEYINIDKDIEFNKNNLEKNKKLKYNNYRYCEFSGLVSPQVRIQNKDIFNNPNNKYGDYCKIILVSSMGSEGINLLNVTQVHITEPYWNEVRIEQIISSAIQFCEHIDIYRYNMIKYNGTKTIEEKIEEISKKKYKLLSSFINSVKEASIDCELFKNHNMANEKYKCFQFTEDALFEFPVTEAYTQNLEIDKTIDNGLNAYNSTIKNIKIYKITGIIQISNNLYSPQQIYWINFDTGVIYDYILIYPIGKVLKNTDGIYDQLQDAYIIKTLINIPEVDKEHYI